MYPGENYEMFFSHDPLDVPSSMTTIDIEMSMRDLYIEG